MICSHEKPNHYWVNEHQDDDGYTVDGHWVYDTVSLLTDVDLHRYRCTGCGWVGYYSGAARAFHEHGVRSDIPGLGG